MHGKEKDTYEYFKEYKHTKEDCSWTQKKICFFNCKRNCQANEGANGGQCIIVGVAHHLQLFDRLSLTAKKVIVMHVMGVKNVHDVLPEISVLAKQIQPQGPKKTKGLKPHAQRLEDLAVVQWALGDGVTLVDVIDKGVKLEKHMENYSLAPTSVQVKVRELGHMDIEACAIMQEGESENQVLSPCACPPMTT
ncbi:unnamed protein product [Sphagnum jensenii]|uniref:Uncharacterized protein n=1 Tax=Sphagnum jensenii TaxID=128206 RepID=A0ABP1BJG6_9BRYO